jgi:hypothetical protein
LTSSEILIEINSRREVVNEINTKNKYVLSQIKFTHFTNEKIGSLIRQVETDTEGSLKLQSSENFIGSDEKLDVPSIGVSLHKVG